MMDIRIITIAHEKQDYPTIGNWSFDQHGLVVTVSNVNNEDYEFLVGLHEVIESVLCKKAGVSEQLVTAFDKLFEAEREAGLHGPDDEPGDDSRAPYRAQHRFATRIEKLVAERLGVEWPAYEAAIAALSQGEGK